MATTTVTLSESETRAIQALSQSEGKTEEEILHEAIEQFLAQHANESRLAAFRGARGMWQERQDLPDPATIRNEWNRY